MCSASERSRIAGAQSTRSPPSRRAASNRERSSLATRSRVCWARAAWARSTSRTRASLRAGSHSSSCETTCTRRACCAGSSSSPRRSAGSATRGSRRYTRPGSSRVGPTSRWSTSRVCRSPSSPRGTRSACARSSGSSPASPLPSSTRTARASSTATSSPPIFSSPSTRHTGARRSPRSWTSASPRSPTPTCR